MYIQCILLIVLLQTIYTKAKLITILNRNQILSYDNVRLAASAPTDAGLGTFARTFIAANTWLGEYEGEVFTDDSHSTAYAWSISRSDSYAYNIDGARIATSNWLRWVNCPRNRKEENVMGVYCYGKILYVVAKPIYPSQELMAYYGDAYAQSLGIDVSEFSEPITTPSQSQNTQQCGCPCR